MITANTRQVPIVSKDGVMLEIFYNWQLNVTNLAPIVGEGSPEGVVEARVPRFYVQTDGAVGSKLWIKVLQDIGGDRTMGWELS